MKGSVLQNGDQSRIYGVLLHSIHSDTRGGRQFVRLAPSGGGGGSSHRKGTDCPVLGSWSTEFVRLAESNGRHIGRRARDREGIWARIRRIWRRWARPSARVYSPGARQSCRSTIVEIMTPFCGGYGPHRVLTSSTAAFGSRADLWGLSWLLLALAFVFNRETHQVG